MSSKKRDSRKELHSRSSLLSSKLRMDSRPQQPRITDPSVPAGRRREIDTVMKKARNSSPNNGYWDKKLLEVEAKDPNRWRHSGYKQMYIGGSSSPSPSRRSSSPFRARRRSRTPRSPQSLRSRSRSYGRRSPPQPRSPRQPRTGRPRSPPSGRRTPPSRRSPRRSPPSRHSPPSRRSPISRRSPSASSLSSCSDDSCSVCSPRTRARDRRLRSRSRSVSVPRSRAKNRPSKQPATASTSGKARAHQRAPVSPPAAVANRRTAKSRPSDPRRVPPPSRVRARATEVIELSPSPPARTAPTEIINRREKNKKKKERKDKEKVLLAKVKTERPSKKRRTSPTPAESSGSEDSSSSSLSAVVASTRLTLSERFGKMAQWSVDRRDIENMRITKNNTGDLKVMIEQEERLYDSPPLRYSHSPAPIGHYPDELMSSGPTGLAAWDDVRVRYQYYKDLGYLRDLTLDDYIKWEQWWYKYQEWLKNERYYEHWMAQNRRRRKRIPATQRLN